MQVKSKQRVANYGEVYTAPREVNAMLDLVADECVRVDSRFLEPACGTGNFLVEVLARKLHVIQKNKYKKHSLFEAASLSAVCSIYGIDILEDNVAECRARLFSVFEAHCESFYKRLPQKDGAYLLTEEMKNADFLPRPCYVRAVKFVLKKNIIAGDALSLKTVSDDPIIFSEWQEIDSGFFLRTDYSFKSLLDNANLLSSELFADKNNAQDNGLRPIKKYPPVHYNNLTDTEAIEANND